uniref:CD58 molecule n=1 Tax=Rousettus aegyptiacus TaxID=9407 RepID=A0A7J8BCZ7_ROUAE|nr:CD58 molecule [Rousettus aegyptiacus]
MAAGVLAGRHFRVLSLVCLWRWIVLTSCDVPWRYGAVNGSVTLDVPGSTSFEDIMWRQDRNKVTEWRRNDVETTYPPFRGRISLNKTTGALTIFNLQPSDGAEYEFESSGRTMTRYVLKVLEPLPSPTLNCTSTGENITVSCEIPEDYESHQAPIRYSWSCPLAQCNNSPEPTMSFQKKDGFLQKILCTVSNPLVNKTSSIYLETCVPGDRSRSRYGLIALPIAAIFIFPFVRYFLKYGRNPRRTE